ncbi:FadR/GntR family transcriptional regulator [Oceanicoccus sagamiensis]|uniref:HTH gntR-type domain-containing protein n=1 Tax=Oceanicoccus sagamiensis TaxID=716816 RepID=A0A1X9NC15_9GAMM|nr:GntR family transcriptional regulator [Oceanicoccus sagamiensis]ARN73079.1 hypothetical protein BST96_02525 [Oceanicoccus sagamiensis]
MPKPKTQKLASRLAQQIAKDIFEEGLETGSPLGKEPELLKKYKVSRDSFREAVRILEWQGIAKSVRGPKGGLQVGSPASGAISNLLRDYLQLADTPTKDLLEASRVLNALTIKILSSTLDSEGSDKLFKLTAERKVLHGSPKEEQRALWNVFKEMGQLTNNPALAIFMAPIHEVLTSMALSSRRTNKKDFITEGQQVWRNIHKCTAAIIAGDEATAVTHMNYYLDQIEQYMAPAPKLASTKRKTKTSYPTWIKENDNKLAQSFMYQLHHDIHAKQLQPGDRIGQETDLIPKYAVSRSIFREAVRMLEMIGLVEQRKGREGGLVVATPDSSGIVPTISIFLTHMNYDFDKLNQSRLPIEMKVAQLAAKKIDEKSAKALTEAISIEQQASGEEFIPAATRVHTLINRIADNRVFSLYVDVMMDARAFKLEEPRRANKAIKNAKKIKDSHRLLAKAILNKDPSLASRKMIEHRKLMTELQR